MQARDDYGTISSDKRTQDYLTTDDLIRNSSSKVVGKYVDFKRFHVNRKTASVEKIKTNGGKSSLANIR